MALQNAQPTTAPAVEVDLSLPGVAFVTLQGAHDLSTTQSVSDAVAKAGTRRDVLVNLSECTFLDSSVIGDLVRARMELELRDRRLELIIPPKAAAVRRIADVTDLNAILRVHASRDAALASLRADGHEIVVKDLRERFGDVESYVAECSCGWIGNTHTGWRTSPREAQRDGSLHLDEASSPATGSSPSEARRFDGPR
jgi:anti-anti-sigma factor